MGSGDALPGDEEGENTGPTASMSAAQLKQLLDGGKKPVLLDVREPQEMGIVKLEGAVGIPLGSLPERMNELDTADDIVVYCHHGMRSQKAINFLKKMGFDKLTNLAGGIDAWAINVDREMPRY